jgi:hypothetical protein
MCRATKRQCITRHKTPYSRRVYGIAHYCFEFIRIVHFMVHKKQEKKLRNATLASIVEEIRGNAFIHYRVAKFHVGQLLYNRNTKEDGFISSVLVDDGVITYEVWVPKESNSWEAGHWISRWLERVLKLSANGRLGSPAKN